MLDQSMPTDEGGKSRLANVVAALNARMQALPPNSAVGLWTFDGTEGRSEVSTGPLSDQVNGQPRSAALTSALNSQSASGGGAVSFTTLRLVYTDVMANFRQGQNNSILVITAGPAHRPVTRRLGPATVHPRGVRSGAAGRRQRHRLRQRLRPRHLGGGRAGQRRHLPEPGQLGLAGAHHGDRHLPGLVRRRRQQAERGAGEDLRHLHLRVVPDPGNSTTSAAGRNSRSPSST